VGIRKGTGCFVQVAQWKLGKVLAALVGCRRKCKTCSNETPTTTKQQQQNPKANNNKNVVPPTALHRPSTKQRNYRLMSSCIDQDRSPKVNNSLVIYQMILLYGTWRIFTVFTRAAAGIISAGHTSGVASPILCLQRVTQNATKPSVHPLRLYTHIHIHAWCIVTMRRHASNVQLGSL